MVRLTLPGDGQQGDGQQGDGHQGGNGAGDASGRVAATVLADVRANLLAAEEPLWIRVGGEALAMTMRTPGDDVELVAGFLVGEAVVRSRADIAEIKLCDGTSCGHGDHDEGELGNIADVALAAGVGVPVGARRNFMTTSACGVCGKTDRLRDARRVFSRHRRAARGRAVHRGRRYGNRPTTCKHLMASQIAQRNYQMQAGQVFRHH